MTAAPTHARERPVALVTGAARRVGAAIARALACDACDLVLTFRSSDDDAGALSADLRALGARVTWERLDLDDPAAVDALGTRLARDLPRLDVLVHNASTYGATPLDRLTAEETLRFFRVNALAPLLLTRALAPLLARSPRPGGGAVVALADMHALGRPRRDHAAYAMSKGALIEMVRSLARDLAPRVRVNAVAPGVVAFPEHGPEADPELQRQYVARVPLARAGSPDDAAGVVRWLALHAHYVTGEVIRVDGGRWLA